MNKLGHPLPAIVPPISVFRVMWHSLPMENSRKRLKYCFRDSHFPSSADTSYCHPSQTASLCAADWMNRSTSAISEADFIAGPWTSATLPIPCPEEAVAREGCHQSAQVNQGLCVSPLTLAVRGTMINWLQSHPLAGILGYQWHSVTFPL